MSSRKIFFLVVIGLIGLIIVDISRTVLEEKYCYNLGFVKLEEKGIKFKRIANDGSEEFEKSETSDFPGSREWHKFYLECRNNFHLSTINLSILEKSYPYYGHFIDW